MLIVLAVLLRFLGGVFAGGLAGALGARRGAACAVGLFYAIAGERSGVLAAAGLPLLLLGTERARGRGGLAVALALAMILASGQPGVAAVDLTLAGAWAFARLTLSPGGWDGRMATRLGAGVLVGASAGIAGAWLLSRAPAPTFAPAPSEIAVLAAVLASGLATLGARRRRAIRWLLLGWVLLDAGRMFDVSLASFLLDIVAPMDDARFVAAAMPSLVLASLAQVALAWPEMRWRRLAVGASLVLAGVFVFQPPPGRGPDAGLAISDGAAVHARALALAPGESVTGVLPAAMARDGAVRRIGVEIGTFLGAANGTLALSLCADARCETGTATLRGAADNAVLFVTLPHELPVSSEKPLRWRASHVGGTQAVAIWLAPADGGRSLAGPAGAIADMAAHVVLEYAAPARVSGPLPP